MRLHTHWAFAQVNAQTQNAQRVWNLHRSD